MPKLDMYDKLMKFEEYKYQMFLMLKEKPMCVSDILELIPITRSSASNMIENFLAQGNLTYHIDINPKTGRKVKIFEYAGIEYVKKTRDEFIDFYVRNGTSKEPVKVEKKPNWHNPYAVVHRLLDSPRPSAPKSKPRSAYKGIGSSFSMYEGI